MPRRSEVARDLRQFSQRVQRPMALGLLPMALGPCAQQILDLARAFIGVFADNPVHTEAPSTSSALGFISSSSASFPQPLASPGNSSSTGVSHRTDAVIARRNAPCQLGSTLKFYDRPSPSWTGLAGPGILAVTDDKMIDTLGKHHEACSSGLTESLYLGKERN